MSKYKNSKTRTGGFNTTSADHPYNELSEGRMLPKAEQIEESVLGAIMLDKNAMSAVLDILKPEIFYKPEHFKIFGAMIRIFNKSQPIDLLTVHEELKKSGELEEVGGPVYLAELTTRVGSAANIEFHARILMQKYIQRQLIDVSTRIIRDSFEDEKDVFDLLDEAEQGLFEITDGNLNRKYSTLPELATQVRARIEELANKKDGLTGVPSGFVSLDRITSGWQPADLIIIAARPSVGKTALVLSMALNAARVDQGVAIFSLEMSSLQIAQRLFAMEAEIPNTSLRDGKLTDHEMNTFINTIQSISGYKIFVDDTPAINTFELRAKCRRLKMQHDIKLIVIDYLQLMSSGGDGRGRGTRENEVSAISRSLKSLAKELNVPVIALSQLSRAVETRGGDKRPQLSDLRESGSIEQDADIVGFIYRPDYYNLEQNLDSDNNEAELLIQKHRNGALGNIKLNFMKKYAKYSDAEDMNYFGNFLSNPVSGSTAPSPINQVIKRQSKANDDDFIDVPF